MTYLKVNLWGREIGRLVWETTTRRIYFMYNPELKDIPDIAPMVSSSHSRNIHLPIYGDDRPIYQGLPPFIADSLPDSWGNLLFDKWVRDNKIPRNQVTPLYKLMFIGTRGMGALEYEPYAEDLNHTRAINIKELYELSHRILEDRDDMVLSANEELTLQALLAIGTSAGGRQMKAIIAINKDTGEIRSGQTEEIGGFDYYILKLGDKSMPIAEIEAAYYYMAVDAGIIMEESSLLSVEGINHFLTKRFDRRKGKKIHIQTLAAMNPEARSYEDLIATGRELAISELEIDQIYSRMVFNVLSNNTDDHNKNFSFMLEENGKWQLAPAYDITFIFNTNGTGPNINRRLSIGGKMTEITKADLLDFAKQNDIKNANEIIHRVAEAIKNFNTYAADSGIAQPWRGIIQKTLYDNLKANGFIENEEDSSSFTDSYGRVISNFSLRINSKGHIDASALINGKRQRKFIRPNMPLHSRLINQDIFNLSLKDKLRLVEDIFPVE